MREMKLILTVQETDNPATPTLVIEGEGLPKHLAPAVLEWAMDMLEEEMTQSKLRLVEKVKGEK